MSINNDKSQLVRYFESAIVNRSLPDVDKVVSLRARLGEPLHTYSLREAETNVKQRLKDAYVIVKLGLSDERNSLRRLDSDITTTIMTIFMNVIGEIAFTHFNDLQDWNEKLNQRVLSKIFEEESKKNIDAMMNAIALKKAENEALKLVENEKKGDRFSNCQIF